MDINAVKFKMNFLYSSKEVCLQMRTVLTECICQAFDDALSSKHGKGYFSLLKGELPDLLKDEGDIYLCDTKVLLECLSSDCNCVKSVAEYFGVDEKELFGAANNLLSFVNNTALDTLEDIEDKIYKEYIDSILKLAEFFTTVRDFDGELFYFKLITHFGAIKNKENAAPVYKVSEAILKSKLDIEYPDFLVCCREAGASICTEDGELCFSINEPKKVMDAAAAFCANSVSTSSKKDKTKKLLGIAAIVLAVIIAAGSAWASNAITRAVIGTPSKETSSQVSENSKDDISDNDKTSSYYDTSSDETTSQYKTAVEKTVDASGRVTEKYYVGFRYKGTSAFDYDEYGVYNGDISSQKIVQMGLRAFSYSEDKGGHLSINVKNGTGELIRNIAFEVRLFTENNQNICGIATSKMMADNNVTLSLNDKESEIIATDIEHDKWYQKDADLGFVNMEVIVSYDIVK